MCIYLLRLQKIGLKRNVIEVEHPRYTFTTINELKTNCDKYSDTWNYILCNLLIFNTVLEYENFYNNNLTAWSDNKKHFLFSIIQKLFAYFLVLIPKNFLHIQYVCPWLKVLTHPISLLHSLCTVSKNNIMYKDS